MPQADVFPMQIAVHLAKYADEFMPILDQFLEHKNLRFVDYLFGVAHSNI